MRNQANVLLIVLAGQSLIETDASSSLFPPARFRTVRRSFVRKEMRHASHIWTLRGGAERVLVKDALSEEKACLSDVTEHSTIELATPSTATAASSSNTSTFIPTRRRRSLRKYSLILVVLSIPIITYRDVLLTIFRDKKAFQAQIQTWLTQVEGMGLKGLVYYTLGFALYNAVGLSSAPVETAAGMAFGVWRGLVASAVGKISGSMLAYVLAKALLHRDSHKKHQHPTTTQKRRQPPWLQLTYASSLQRPLKVSLLLRVSPLPRLLKFIALAALPIPCQIVLLATVLHGLPFTILWSMVGAEAAVQLTNSHGGNVASTSLSTFKGGVLRLLTLASMAFGVVGAPLLFASWMAELKRDHDEQQRRNLDNGGHECVDEMVPLAHVGTPNFSQQQQGLPSSMPTLANKNKSEAEYKYSLHYNMTDVDVNVNHDIINNSDKASEITHEKTDKKKKILTNKKEEQRKGVARGGSIASK